MLFIIKWLQFILLTILQPILCIFGILNNLINLIVIENRTKRKEFNEAMYRFIEINSTFNIFYCIIMFLKLMNTCIFDEAGIYCSSLYETPAIQSYKIIVVHFLGNSLKLCSNVSYFLFALCRLIIISSPPKLSTPITSKNKNTTTQKRFKYLFVAMFIFGVCSLLSLFKLFQYKLNEWKDYRKEFPYEIRDELYCSTSGQYECALFSSFKIVNSILNDICMVVLNILIDVILIKKFHKFLEKKSAVHSVDVDHHKNIQKSKKRINRMVFFNSCLYILSHIPEFTTTLLLILYSRRIVKFCMFNFSCDLINEEAESFGLISIVCQFFIYKVFDKNFRVSYKEIKAKVFCWSKSQDSITNKLDKWPKELKNLKNLIGNGQTD
jgi:hypothetical protein